MHVDFGWFWFVLEDRGGAKDGVAACKNQPKTYDAALKSSNRSAKLKVGPYQGQVEILRDELRTCGLHRSDLCSRLVVLGADGGSAAGLDAVIKCFGRRSWRIADPFQPNFKFHSGFSARRRCGDHCTQKRKKPKVSD